MKYLIGWIWVISGFVMFLILTDRPSIGYFLGISLGMTIFCSAATHFLGKVQ